MKRCPITYQLIRNGNYSDEGLKLLSKTLKKLEEFPFSAVQQIEMAQVLALKLSIQGVQPKLSVRLSVKNSRFEIVEKLGSFIVKPPHHLYEQLPQNEDLTMKLAHSCGIEVPLHGLMYNKDHTLSYFIKRFDRGAKRKKIPVEDFSQLMGFDRDTKYSTSLEKTIPMIDSFCTFPILEKQKFFKLILFNFLIGNEDMHLKNYSLITSNGITKISPAYDLINTTIVLKTTEETALSLNGKKSNLKKRDLVDYLAKERLNLSSGAVDEVLADFIKSFDVWATLIDSSFLSSDKKILYRELINQRRKKIFLD